MSIRCRRQVSAAYLFFLFFSSGCGGPGRPEVGRPVSATSDEDAIAESEARFRQAGVVFDITYTLRNGIQQAEVTPLLPAVWQAWQDLSPPEEEQLRAFVPLLADYAERAATVARRESGISTPCKRELALKAAMAPRVGHFLERRLEIAVLYRLERKLEQHDIAFDNYEGGKLRLPRDFWRPSVLDTANQTRLETAALELAQYAAIASAIERGLDLAFGLGFKVHNRARESKLGAEFLAHRSDRDVRQMLALLVRLAALGITVGTSADASDPLPPARIAPEWNCDEAKTGLGMSKAFTAEQGKNLDEASSLLALFAEVALLRLNACEHLLYAQDFARLLRTLRAGAEEAVDFILFRRRENEVIAALAVLERDGVRFTHESGAKVPKMVYDDTIGTPVRTKQKQEIVEHLRALRGALARLTKIQTKRRGVRYFYPADASLIVGELELTERLLAAVGG